MTWRLWPFAILGLWIVSKFQAPDRVSYRWLNEQERLAMRNEFEGVTWEWPVDKATNERRSA